MRILLINPSSRRIYGMLYHPTQIPLGLAYIASAIGLTDNEVSVIDVEAEHLTEKALREKIIKINPHLVGVTCTTPIYWSAVEICNLVKKISADIKIVLGGIHPTIVPEEAIKPDCIDFIVLGEGERTIIDLITALKENSDLLSIKGLVHKRNGETITNLPQELIQNLDEISFPARHLFKTQKYTFPDSLSKNTFPIITSRGCPGRCTFCNTQNIFGHRFRARTPKNVVDEIEMLIKNYNAQEIHIWDDNFTTNKNRIFAIREELKKRSIKIKFAFPNGLRADFLNEEILNCLKDMGTYSISIGVESGNQELLNKIKKGTSLRQIQTVFQYAKSIGLETWAFFMLGLPDESKETINNTIEFARKLNPDIVKFHILKPYPGTEIYQELKEKGFLLSTNWRQYGIHTSPVHRLNTLNSTELVKLQKTAYQNFYFRPQKFLQQILRLKSWNRMKLNMLTAIGIIRYYLSKTVHQRQVCFMENNSVHPWDSFWNEQKEKTLFGKLLYFFREKVWTKKFLNIAMKYSSCGNVLEAGCGSGLSSILLSKKRGDTIILLDISSSALTVAKESAMKYNVDAIFVQADLQKPLPFSNKTFDLVWNSGTMEHFVAPESIIKEFRRVAYITICIVPSKSIIWGIFLFVIELLGNKIKSNFNEGYTKLYNKEEIKLLFKKAGYKNVLTEKIRPINIFPYVAGIGIE